MINRVEKSDLIEYYSAKNLKTEEGIKYNYSLDWRLFAHRINKNPFFKNFKIISQTKICPICGHELDGKICLHHIDYDHICQRGENILIGKNMPNCKICFNETPDFFISCSIRTVVVHNSCHGKLHNDSKFKDNGLEPNKSDESKNDNKTYTTKQRKTEYKNAYKPWTSEEDKKLEKLFFEGKKTRELSIIFDRKIGAIRSRIKKLEFQKKYRN
ncbi:hypothetical protein SAMN04489761_3396 [Tenacibaculum sp. MAR_2009_124]|uniref:hypothetical protein n=1 Tax=Tenacibaculum sp. MAR_2009_124 TaxID=1250059 RepID=UPI000896EA18|nr:hypothetical protein [Tenacibaculum sp. MAR_2009_124]SEC64971.1 hypothetical protein SAMN04489761_3396 [Tenacibaculum sp. MAR_2009_124]